MKNTILTNGEQYKIAKGKFCFRCGHQLYKEHIITQYSYYCSECDENMDECESIDFGQNKMIDLTNLNNEELLKLHKNTIKKINCSDDDDNISNVASSLQKIIFEFKRRWLHVPYYCFDCGEVSLNPVRNEENDEWYCLECAVSLNLTFHTESGHTNEELNFYSSTYGVTMNQAYNYFVHAE